jgi:hypothetical protein
MFRTVATVSKKFFAPALLTLALLAPVSLTNTAEAASSCPTAQCAHLIVHYKRNAPTNYSDWGLWLWAFKGSPSLPASTVTPFSSTVLDSKGYALIDTQVPISPGVTQLGMIPRLKSGWTKDVDLDRIVNLDGNKFAEIWIQQNDGYLYRNDTFVMPAEIWGATIETFRTIKVVLSKANGTAGLGF